eukprot:6501664-Pyramimonas_sp.AAC.1
MRVLGELPSRTFPLVASDVNDGLGLASGRHGPIVIDSTALGTHGLSQEHQAGTLYRELAENFDLAAVNTFFPCGPSYYGQPARRAQAAQASERLRPSAPRGGRASTLQKRQDHHSTTSTAAALALEPS